MPDCIKNRALYSTCVTVLAIAGFALALTATILPRWGYYSNPTVTTPGRVDRGHFGPWQTCVETYYGSAKCGDLSRFQPVVAVRISGYFAIAGILMLGIFSVLSVIHLAMVVSKEKVMMKFKSAVIAKVVFSILSEIIAIFVGVLFAFQTDDKENSYQITRGESFYLQVGLIIIIFLLFIASLYDLIFARRSTGDPTVVKDPTGVEATTFNNPGFREKNRGGHTISMTEASGKPYSSNSGTNGSVVSMSTVLSSNGSTMTSFSKGPLRSSLKKPRVSRDPNLGIHNPGFSGSSPTLPRDGMKKVRIQTQSTEV